MKSRRKTLTTISPIEFSSILGTVSKEEMYHNLHTILKLCRTLTFNIVPSPDIFEDWYGVYEKNYNYCFSHSILGKVRKEKKVINYIPPPKIYNTPTFTTILPFDIFEGWDEI